ncbi:hypothetical protein ATCCBAA256_04460 [Mycobacterium montefiorense]|nr:hypothetical protein ATCCBAA256_04460 [Mycobacterium montefiorense]
MAFTPAGLQSGVAAADGAPTIPKAIAPSRHPALMPAIRRRATILLRFMIDIALRIGPKLIRGDSRFPEIQGS